MNEEFIQQVQTAATAGIFIGGIIGGTVYAFVKLRSDPSDEVATEPSLDDTIPGILVPLDEYIELMQARIAVKSQPEIAIYRLQQIDVLQREFQKLQIEINQLKEKQS